ncbi:MAG: hypothetical protein V3U51_02080, partial [Thermoplasmata archaeon]
VRITSPKGTDLTMSIKDRDWFSDTFFDWRTMKWINLPVGEVVVGPVENSMEGNWSPMGPSVVSDLSRNL